MRIRSIVTVVALAVIHSLASGTSRSDLSERPELRNAVNNLRERQGEEDSIEYQAHIYYEMQLIQDMMSRISDRLRHVKEIADAESDSMELRLQRIKGYVEKELASTTAARNQCRDLIRRFQEPGFIYRYENYKMEQAEPDGARQPATRQESEPDEPSDP
jgi:hypothetical protein